MKLHRAFEQIVQWIFPMLLFFLPSELWAAQEKTHRFSLQDLPGFYFFLGLISAYSLYALASFLKHLLEYDEEKHDTSS